MTSHYWCLHHSQFYHFLDFLDIQFLSNSSHSSLILLALLWQDTMHLGRLQSAWLPGPVSKLAQGEDKLMRQAAFPDFDLGPRQLNSDIGSRRIRTCGFCWKQKLFFFFDFSDFSGFRRFGSAFSKFSKASGGGVYRIKTASLRCQLGTCFDRSA